MIVGSSDMTCRCPAHCIAPHPYLCTAHEWTKAHHWTEPRAGLASGGGDVPIQDDPVSPPRRAAGDRVGGAEPAGHPKSGMGQTLPALCEGPYIPFLSKHYIEVDTGPV